MEKVLEKRKYKEPAAEVRTIEGKNYYNATAAGLKLGIARVTVAKYLQSGKYPRRRIGRSYFIEESELLKMLEPETR